MVSENTNCRESPLLLTFENQRILYLAIFCRILYIAILVDVQFQLIYFSSVSDPDLGILTGWDPDPRSGSQQRF